MEIKNKITRKRRGKFFEKKEEILEDFDKGLNFVRLGEKYNLSTSTIFEHFKNLGIKGRKYSQRKNHCDENYFNEIDTEIKAYFLGFLMADGCVTNNSLVLQLQEMDKEVLERLKKEIKFTGSLYFCKKKKESYQNSYILSIRNKNLCNSLKEKGIVERKTFITEFPEYLHETLIRHFIRGLFDGDGCFSVCISKNVVAFSIVGSKNLMEYIQQYLIYKLKLSKTKFSKVSQNFEVVEMCYGGNNQVKKIMDWLYKDSTIYLERKYKKFKNFYSIPEEEMELELN